MARKVNKIILHCSDSDVMKHNDVNIIKLWHIARGFKTVGYHYFIQKNGSAQGGRPVTQEGAHVKGHNGDSIGICLHGRKEFTNDQFRSLAKLIRSLAAKFKLKKGFIFGHNDFTDQKTCPNFDVQRFIKYYLPEFEKNGKGTFEITKPAAGPKAGPKEGSKEGSEKVTGSVKVESESEAAE